MSSAKWWPFCCSLYVLSSQAGWLWSELCQLVLRYCEKFSDCAMSLEKACMTSCPAGEWAGVGRERGQGSYTPNIWVTGAEGGQHYEDIDIDISVNNDGSIWIYDFCTTQSVHQSITIWRNFRHLVHWMLSFWQLSVQLDSSKWFTVYVFHRDSQWTCDITRRNETKPVCTWACWKLEMRIFNFALCLYLFILSTTTTTDV